MLTASSRANRTHWYEVLPTGSGHGYTGPDFDEALAHVLNLDQVSRGGVLITYIGASRSVATVAEIAAAFGRLFPGARAEVASRPEVAA